MRAVALLKGTMKMRRLTTDLLLKEDRVVVVKELVITLAKRTPMEDLEEADLSNNQEEIWVTVVNLQEDTEMIMSRTTMRDLHLVDNNQFPEILQDSNMMSNMKIPLDTQEVEEVAVLAWAEWEIEEAPPEVRLGAKEADTIIDTE